MDVLATWLPEHLCARVCVCVCAGILLYWFVSVCARACVSVSVWVYACVYVYVSVSVCVIIFLIIRRRIDFFFRQYSCSIQMYAYFFFFFFWRSVALVVFFDLHFVFWTPWFPLPFFQSQCFACNHSVHFQTVFTSILQTTEIEKWHGMMEPLTWVFTLEVFYRSGVNRSICLS